MKSPLNRGGLRFYLVLFAVAALRSTPWTVLWGAPLVVLGVVLHVWAKGCLRQDREVTTTGPYRFVRHPFYVANALVDAGVAVMSGWWLLCALLPLWWLAVYVPVVRREEAFLAERHPAAYGAYRRQVSAFIPLRRPLPRSGQGFSWRNENIARDNAIARALRLLAYPLFFFVWNEVRVAGLASFRDAHYLELLALVMLVTFHVVAWQIERHAKRRRLILGWWIGRPECRALFCLLVLTAAAAVVSLETELDHVVLPAGAVVLAGSWLACRRQRPPLLAEAFALIGVAVMCELLWLTALPIMLYTALVLDNRLGEPALHASPRRTGSSLEMWSQQHLYHAVVGLGIIAATLKEAFIG